MQGIFQVRKTMQNFSLHSSNVQWAYLHNLRHSFEEVSKLSEAIVGYSTLSAEVVMVRRDELVKWHAASRVVLQQVNYF